MRFHVGTLTVPATTGSQIIRFDQSVYAELESAYATYNDLLAGESTYAGMLAGEPVGTPQAVVFFGTNWTTWDSPVIGGGVGLFRGIAAPKWDAPSTIVQNAASVIPAGDAHINWSGAIYQTTPSATVLYAAGLTSFDSDGFTLNWFTAAAGGYKIVYVALLDVAHVGAIVGMFDGTTFNLGFKAGASLLHGAWAGPETLRDGTTQEYYGGASYPGGNHLDWMGAGATLANNAANGAYINTLANGPPTSGVVTGMHGGIAGTFISSNLLAHPTGSPAAGNTFLMSGDAADAGMVLVWDDEHNRCVSQTPAQAAAATSVRAGLPFAPSLLIGYTISDEPPGQAGTGGRGAIGMSVVAPGFQWCATADGHSAVGAFQSFERGFCDAVSGTNVHAGSVVLTDDGFVLTTQQDTTTLAPVVWHAFGQPLVGAAWIPQIYRRIIPVP